MRAVSLATTVWIALINLVTVIVSWGAASILGLNDGSWFADGDFAFIRAVTQPETESSPLSWVPGLDLIRQLTNLSGTFIGMFWLNYPLWEEWEAIGKPLQWFTRLMGAVFTGTILIQVGPTLLQFGQGVGSTLGNLLGSGGRFATRFLTR